MGTRRKREGERERKERTLSPLARAAFPTEILPALLAAAQFRVCARARARAILPFNSFNGQATAHPRSRAVALAAACEEPACGSKNGEKQREMNFRQINVSEYFVIANDARHDKNRRKKMRREKQKGREREGKGGKRKRARLNSNPARARTRATS